MGDRWTADDVGDQSGRLAVITGANTGLGLETARQLAMHGAEVVLAVRNLDKGRTAAEDIEASAPGSSVGLVQLDLGSLDSVRSAAAEIGERWPRIDLLINNAGVMYTDRGRTADGFETQIGTNHLGHFALDGLLLERMLDVDGSRVVSVASLAHRVLSTIDIDDLHSAHGYNRVAAYGRSKLANLLFIYDLQRRLAAADAATIAVAAHPGVSATELMRNMPGGRQLTPLAAPFAQSAEAGALPTLRAATDPAVTGGEYFGPDGFMELRGSPVLVESNSRSHDRELQDALWKLSEQETGVTYPV